MAYQNLLLVKETLRVNLQTFNDLLNNKCSRPLLPRATCVLYSYFYLIRPTHISPLLTTLTYRTDTI